MGNIRNFDEWKIINEKNTNAFNAEIKDIGGERDNIVDKTTDNIVVRETDNSDPIVYSIKDTKVISKQKQTGVGENGDTIGTPEENVEEITDPQLKLDIKKAAYAIRDVKDRLYAKEILRLTGGDISDATDEIRNIIDNAHSTINQSLESNGDGDKSIKTTFEKDPSNIKYISINDKWEGKYTLTSNDISNIYNVQSQTIGKGEYLLPFLFCDVYKNKAYGDRAKGDNYFMDNDGGKYILEVKGSNSPMSFSNHKRQNKNAIIQYLESAEQHFIENEDNDPEKYINMYKTAIAASLLNYGKSQLNKYNGGYLCFFNEKKSNEPSTTKNTDKKTTPIGMLFVNIGGIKETDIEPTINNDNSGQLGELKKIIDIDFNNYQTKADFMFKCIGDNTNYSIHCTLKQEYINKILNFMKERDPLQKKKGRKRKNDIKNVISNIDISNDENFEESIVLNFERFINEIYTK